MTISNLTAILYKKMGLPDPNGSLNASYNKFTKKIDGNCDTNLDGIINNNQDKNGVIEPEEVWQEVLNPRNRDKYSNVLQFLRSQGFEDSLEKAPEAVAFAHNLVAWYKPKTQVAKALLLLQAIIPQNGSFQFGQTVFHSLSNVAQGGLGSIYDADTLTTCRSATGSPVPKEILATTNNGSKNDCVELNCLELSNLLIVSLRSLGIEAQIKIIPHHAYVIATLDGQKYVLDPAKQRFLPAGNEDKTSTDKDGIISHYANETGLLIKQGRYDQALANIQLVLEMRSGDPGALSQKGTIMMRKGLLAQTQTEKRVFFTDAFDYFDEAFDTAGSMDKKYLQPGIARDLGKLFYAQDDYDKALEYYNLALEIDPRDTAALDEKISLLVLSNKYLEALATVELAIDQEPANQYWQTVRDDIVEMYTAQTTYEE